MSSRTPKSLVSEGFRLRSLRGGRAGTRTIYSRVTSCGIAVPFVILSEAKDLLLTTVEADPSAAPQDDNEGGQDDDSRGAMRVSQPRTRPTQTHNRPSHLRENSKRATGVEDAGIARCNDLLLAPARMHYRRQPRPDVITGGTMSLPRHQRWLPRAGIPAFAVIVLSASG